MRQERLRRALRLAFVAWVALCTTFAASPSRADDAQIGREIFQESCAACHGKDMVNPGGLVFDLRTFPLTEAARFRLSVLNGTPKGMPGWRAQLSDADVEALWSYLKAVKSGPQ